MKLPLLFIVPSTQFDLHAKTIRMTLWAVNNDCENVVMSASSFVDTYGSLSIEDAAKELQSTYDSVCNLGILSRREQAEYTKVIGPILEYIVASRGL
jgi:hypothetical protein